jgi:hypothetical protein
LVPAVTAASPASIVAPSAARDMSEREVRMIDSLKVVSDQMPGARASLIAKKGESETD